MRTLLRLGAALAFLALLLPTAWVTWEYGRDPMPLVDLPVGPCLLRRVETRSFRTASGEDRRLLELEFDGPPEGPLRAALSLPESPGLVHSDAGAFAHGAEPPHGESPLPVVVLLGGLEVGRESLRYVPRHGPNALLAYEYPRPSRDLYQGSPLLKAPRIRRASLAVPAQVRALLEWAQAQPWADPQRMSLLGYSFGAMFVPAAARVAAAHGLSLRTLVMAYGGARLPALLAANTNLRPAWLRPLAARVVGALVRPLEPALHLPHLPGEALFITGLRDDRIPLPCARAMQAMKPPPRTVLDLDEGHMDPREPDRNRRIVAASQAWLVARGAMDP